jgi:hypothetical protein
LNPGEKCKKQKDEKDVFKFHVHSGYG